MQQNIEQNIVIHIPVNLKKWGGRKVIIGAGGKDLRGLDANIRRDDKLLKALGRAYKWQKLLDSGKCFTADDIAAMEDLSKAYVLRILRLNRLSPKIVSAIISGTQPGGFGLSDVQKPFPPIWQEQEKLFGF